MKLTFWLRCLQMSNMKPLSERTVWAPLHCGHFLSGVFLCDLTDCAKSLNTLSNLHANQEPQAVAPCYSCPLQKFDWAAFHLTDMSFVQSHSKFLFCFFGFVFVPPHSFRHTFNLFHFILFIISRFLVPTLPCQEYECESLDWIITHTNPLCNDELCRGILFFSFHSFCFSD